MWNDYHPLKGLVNIILRHVYHCTMEDRWLDTTHSYGQHAYMGTGHIQIYCTHTNVRTRLCVSLLTLRGQLDCVCVCVSPYPESTFSHELVHKLGVTVGGESN